MTVKKYRKKPVVIEAVQWNGMNLSEIQKFAEGVTSVTFHDEAWLLNECPVGVELTIRTLEGDLKASRGDYIIKGVQGEFYPCKPDIFEQTYEEV